MAGPPKEKSRDEIDLKLLRELATLPSNKFCFDCGQRGPTYVNVTIGAFVCSSCGGLLRGLNPPHRVKSLTVCSFTELEMDRIKSRGNEYCTHIWLGKYDPKIDSVDLSSPDKRKQFMILKYEEKKFYVDPREAIKKMKPRAPTAPSNNTPTAVPRSQTVVPNSQSTATQRPIAMSQAFSAGDILNNTVPFVMKGFENDPFQEVKQNESSGDCASFADFSSAFGNTVPKESSIQTAPPTSSSSSSHKKHAPPPPDRYAALADLDNELNQQQTIPDTGVPVEVAVSVSGTPFWSAVAPTMPSTAVFAPGVQNPFQASQPWPQQIACAQNPFQVMAQPVPKVILQTQNSNGVLHWNGVESANQSLPSNNIAAVYWPSVSSQPWGKNNVDPFTNKNGSMVLDKSNPWAQSIGSSSANPFTNGSFTTGGPSSSSSGVNAKNPFL